MKINGLGRFVFKNETCIEGEFSFNWSSKSFHQKPKLQINAVSKDRYLIHQLNHLPFFPWDLKGKTADNREITAQGLALKTRGEKINQGIDEVSLGFNCNLVQIGKNDVECDYIDFYFPNLFIAFNEFEKVGKVSTLNISNITLEYNDIYNITFTGLNELVTKKQDIISKGEDIITVKVTVRKATNHIYFYEAKELVDLMSDLMSFVYGSPVNWIHANGYKGEKEIYNEFRDVNYADLNTFRQLIPINFPRCLTSYLSQTFSVYAAFDAEKRKAYKKFNSGLHFSSERLVFPAPFTSLGSCIEDFVKYAVPETESHYIKRAERREIDPIFAEWVTDNLIPLLDDADKADFSESGMKQKLSALIQRNLRSRISKLLDYNSINYEESWVSEFVKKRNSAAHGSYNFENDDYLKWSRMMSLLELLLLKELNYKGDYIDWSVSPPVQRRL